MLPQAAGFLAAGWNGDGPLDLSDRLIVVPTRQAGRRLRETIASLAAQRDQAVFAPRVVTPEALIAQEATAGFASRLESLLAWAEVLVGCELEEFRAVFPADPPERDLPWALRLAQNFVRLRRTLAEGGMQLQDVPRQAGGDLPELERWQQLAELEVRYAGRLAGLGLRDVQAAEIEAARTAEPPAGITRIVVLATPDPLPLALTALAGCAQKVPVDIVVFAPPQEAEAFDGWGRPQPEFWAQRELAWPDFEARVRLGADPAAQAEQVAELAQHYAGAEGMLGVGVADPEVLPRLETALREAGQEVFNPEGRPRRGDALDQLLTALMALVDDESFAAMALLARCPDFLEQLGRRAGENFSAASFLKELDSLQARHLPTDLAAARRLAPGNPGLVLAAEWQHRLKQGEFPANVLGVLGEVFAGRQFDPAQPDEAAALEAAAAWGEVVRDIRAAQGQFPAVEPAVWSEVALRQYRETLRFDERPAGAVELQGWLELLWEDAPHLVIAGFNDGCVPDAVVGDAFLPESLRARLGLKSNAVRFARDAYLLQALVAARGPAGRLDVLVGRTSAAGDPLRPSRLLLRCPDVELPRRIDFLFRPAEAARSNPAWRRAWRLRPTPVPAPQRVAVTGLRAWLDCPFRFYLSRVRRMERVDPAKTELDALDFGTLCHTALEAMGREPALRDCVEPATLRAFLLEALEAEAIRRYGATPTLPLLVQLESARQRLSRAAEVQAETRAQGWVIERVETAFKIEIGGLVVSGKIDRIDRHETTGEIRVLDYKTSDKPVNPAEAHLKSVPRGETPPVWALLDAEAERPRRWVDLQLPLYGQALAAEFGPAVTCGYFNLPKAVGETSLALWTEFTPELRESALRCATGVCAAIRAEEFWPPNENVRAEWDEFATLFHEGVAASVAWEERQG